MGRANGRSEMAGYRVEWTRLNGDLVRSQTFGSLERAKEFAAGLDYSAKYRLWQRRLGQQLASRVRDVRIVAVEPERDPLGG